MVLLQQCSLWVACSRHTAFIGGAEGTLRTEILVRLAFYCCVPMLCALVPLGKLRSRSPRRSQISSCEKPVRDIHELQDDAKRYILQVIKSHDAVDASA